MLVVCVEDIEFEFREQPEIEWLNFVLNPRRLRGSDFLMRWSQGVWSEERIVQAVEDSQEFFAVPYGPSGAAPEDDVRAYELYFERLEAAGLGNIKRPDLLVFRKVDYSPVTTLVEKAGGSGELPFLPEDNPLIRSLLQKAFLAVECENSLWKAARMPDYGLELKPQKRLGGKPGLKKNAVVPTIILKEEDRQPLQLWQDQHHIPIHIWHVFFDMAYGISLDEAQKLIDEGYILPTTQTFQSPGGATTRKTLYKIYYHHGYLLGNAFQEPALKARFIEDKNEHILPYVHFEGDKIALSAPALEILRKIAYANSKSE